MQFRAEGTLGDAYVATCKLSRLGAKDIKVHHYTECKYWENEIRDIYSLLPNVEVEFVDEIEKELQLISSLPKVGDMCYFPKFNKIDTRFDLHDYIVIQINAGKPAGAPLSKNNTINTKLLNIEIIDSIIKNNRNATFVLLGTDERYKNISGCINLVGKTTLKESIAITQRCGIFIGLEGLLSFVSLSNKNKTTIFFTDNHWIAIGHRVIDTPWEKYCMLHRVSEFGIRQLAVT